MRSCACADQSPAVLLQSVRVRARVQGCVRARTRGGGDGGKDCLHENELRRVEERPRHVGRDDEGRRVEPRRGACSQRLVVLLGPGVRVRGPCATRTRRRGSLS